MSTVNMRERLDRAESNLGNARIALNDWVNCSTPEQLERWRQAQRRLIAAAKAVGELEAQLALPVLEEPPVSNEERVISHVCAHWFTQGGEMQFGRLGECHNADEVVSEILRVVRLKQEAR